MEDISRLKYIIALGMIKGVGPRHAGQLICEYPDAEEIFKEKPAFLARIPYVGAALSEGVSSGKPLIRAEKEIEFCLRNNITVIGRGDSRYPAAVSECPDAPLALFVKGGFCLGEEKMISVVGTRHSTTYGAEVTREIIKGLSLSFPGLVVVSGLAYGIDICAHKSALDNGLKTIAVLAHGLDRVYPSDHTREAVKIINNGALVTEYPSGTGPEKGNFLARNRIIAALSAGTIVVESDRKGGAMATARIAASYNREVMAVPGRVFDKYSRGCNHMIHSNVAVMVTSADEVAEVMGWSSAKKDIQQTIDFGLSPEEKKITALLDSGEPMHLNHIAERASLGIPATAGILIDLEMRQVIKQLPGSMYRIKNPV